MTHYEVLGILPTDDIRVVKSAYRVAVKRTHPDSNSSGDDSAFIQVHKSYEYLVANLKEYFKKTVGSRSTENDVKDGYTDMYRKKPSNYAWEREIVSALLIKRTDTTEVLLPIQVLVENSKAKIKFENHNIDYIYVMDRFEFDRIKNKCGFGKPRIFEFDHDLSKGMKDFSFGLDNFDFSSFELTPDMVLNGFVIEHNKVNVDINSGNFFDPVDQSNKTVKTRRYLPNFRITPDRIITDPESNLNFIVNLDYYFVIKTKNNYGWPRTLIYHMNTDVKIKGDRLFSSAFKKMTIYSDGIHIDCPISENVYRNGSEKGKSIKIRYGRFLINAEVPKNYHGQTIVLENQGRIIEGQKREKIFLTFYINSLFGRLKTKILNSTYKGDE